MSVDPQSIAQHMGKYQNPLLDDVVGAAMDGFDFDAGRTRAAQAAQAAGNKAFGGSRYALREAATEGELARARASTDANLRYRAFDTAAGLGAQDAGLAQQASQFNAQAGMETSRFNAGNALQRALAQAGFDQERGRYNADAVTAAARYASDWSNQGMVKNAELAQAMEMLNLGNRQSMEELNVNHHNNRVREQAALDAAWQGQNADRSTAADLYRANVDNKAEEDFAQSRMAADRYRADTNNGSEREFAAAQTGANRDFANSSNEFAGRYADTANQFAQSQWAAETEAARSGADRAWQQAVFNAGQEDNALARQMQAGGALADVIRQGGADEREAIQLMAALGDQQRGVDQQQAMAELAQLETLGKLYGATPFQLFSGQTGTGTTRMNGTTTEKAKPSLFNSALAAANVAAKVATAASSERRVKKDVEKVGTLPNGLNVYDFRYVWDADDAPLRRGVMVDEVEKIQPEALGPMAAGIQTVDYSKLAGWVQ